MEGYLKCVTKSVKHVLIGLHFIPVQLPAGGWVEHHWQTVQQALTHAVCTESPTHTHTHHGKTLININKQSHSRWRSISVVFLQNSSETDVNQPLGLGQKLWAEFTCFQMSAAQVYFVLVWSCRPIEPPCVVQYSSLFISSGITTATGKDKKQNMTFLGTSCSSCN